MEVTGKPRPGAVSQSGVVVVSLCRCKSVRITVVKVFTVGLDGQTRVWSGLWGTRLGTS